MSIQSLLLNGVGSAVAAIYPPAAPIVSFLQAAEPYAEKALPIISTAIKEGPAAFAAAKQAAPEFFEQLTAFTSSLKQLAGATGGITDGDLAFVAAHIARVDPPGWTHDETQRWWDRDKGSA